MAKHLRTPPPRLCGGERAAARRTGRQVRVLAGVKLVTVAALLGLVSSAWAGDQPPGPVDDLGYADAPQSVVAQAMREHRCTTTGFGDARQPRGALVRTPGGRLRAVSFDHGWAVFTQERPGTLVAVCLDPPTPGWRG